MCDHSNESSLRSKRFRAVWEQRKTEERDFRCFSRAKNGARAKKRKRGVGEGNEETLADKPLGFENRLLDLSCLSAHTKITCSLQPNASEV